MRREAGYRSAKDFAEVLNIPSSTYARYERAVECPECGIPLAAAWQIADALGCSIDIDERVAVLSLTNQEAIMGFLGYLEQLEANKPRRSVM